MRHLLGIAGLSRESLDLILQNAEQLLDVSRRDIKKVPTLRGRTIINMFLEASTRTRGSFEIAGKRLSADVVNIGGNDSSISKGETLLDTARNLEAMAPDILVVRHQESGAPHLLAKWLKTTSVINAGDGMHEHPTQALLDALSLKQHFAKQDRGIEGLRVTFVGDIFHSRVVRSNMLLHRLLGNHVTLVAPPTLLPLGKAWQESYPGIKVSHSLSEGLEGADVVYCLRMQLERMSDFYVPTLNEYSREFCVSERWLTRYAPNCVVMHPGPMNRGTEIASDVADGPRSLIGNQVENGVAIRMAILYLLTQQEIKMEALNVAVE